MAILRQQYGGLTTMLCVWRKFRLLDPVQVFVVSSLGAAAIAIALGITQSRTNQTAFLRDLFWPNQLDPYIFFASGFVSALSVLLAYYHLGRIGGFLGVAVSAVMWYAVLVGALLLFLRQAPWLATAEYVAICLLLYAVILTAHIKASHSWAIRDAQRALHLNRQA